MRETALSTGPGLAVLGPAIEARERAMQAIRWPQQAVALMSESRGYMATEPFTLRIHRTEIEERGRGCVISGAGEEVFQDGGAGTKCGGARAIPCEVAGVGAFKRGPAGLRKTCGQFSDIKSSMSPRQASPSSSCSPYLARSPLPAKPHSSGHLRLRATQAVHDGVQGRRRHEGAA